MAPSDVRRESAAETHRVTLFHRTPLRKPDSAFPRLVKRRPTKTVRNPVVYPLLDVATRVFLRLYEVSWPRRQRRSTKTCQKPSQLPFPLNVVASIFTVQRRPTKTGQLFKQQSSIRHPRDVRPRPQNLIQSPFFGGCRFNSLLYLHQHLSFAVPESATFDETQPKPPRCRLSWEVVASLFPWQHRPTELGQTPIQPRFSVGRRSIHIQSTAQRRPTQFDQHPSQ